MTQSNSGTLVERFFPAKLAPRGKKRLARLALEGSFFTSIALYLTLKIGFAQPGLVSVFLISASLSKRIQFLLDENRTTVWETSSSNWSANRLTALSFLSIFGGVIAAYFIYSFSVGLKDIRTTFGFAIDASNLGDASLLTRQFSSFGRILSNNLLVLVCISILAFVYRAYGAMLALGWNACVWAAAITTLTLRTAQELEIVSSYNLLIAVIALLPHLIIEGFAYILGALSAIYLSQAISKYPFSDPRFLRVTQACFMLSLIAVITVVVGSGIESTLVPYILAKLALV